jgi:hypothetical protein
LAAIDFGVERGLLDREQLVTQQFTKRKELFKMAPPTTYVSPRQQMAQPEDASGVSYPTAEPTLEPQPLAIYHEPLPVWKRIGIGVAIVAAMCGIGYAVTYQISGPAEAHLAALRAYNSCLEAHKDDASACAAQEKAAGVNQ